MMDHKTRDILIKAHGLGVRRSGRWLIRNVDMSVRRGAIVTLIGPNGSGKSTTVKAILGLLALDEGHVERLTGIRIGYVPQSLTIDRMLPLTVGRLLTLTRRAGEDEISRSLAQVGLTDFANAQVQHLSGGEFQRALLARALLREPDLLVLDEPVQGVDFSGEIALYELIREIRHRLGCGILLISHDLHIVMAETDEVVCINGHVCCSGPPHSVAENAEYRRLFGPRAAQSFAIYRHHHDHAHGAHGEVIPLDGGEAGRPAQEPVHETGDADA